MPAPQTSVAQLNTWKHPEMRHFAVCLIRHALARLNAGNIHFTTDCVPDAERVLDGSPIATNIPGNVITQLKQAHVIRAVGVIVEGKFYADSEKSSRGDAKTRPVDKYELVTRANAEEFLRRNKVVPPRGQIEMDIPLAPLRHAYV